VEQGIQLDWRPPEYAQAYRDFVMSSEGTRAKWPMAYPVEQWKAVRLGQFLIENYA
jgi:hypothetical protein